MAVLMALACVTRLQLGKQHLLLAIVIMMAFQTALIIARLFPMLLKPILMEIPWVMPVILMMMEMVFQIVLMTVLWMQDQIVALKSPMRFLLLLKKLGQRTPLTIRKAARTLMGEVMAW